MAELTNTEVALKELDHAKHSVYAQGTELSFPNERQMTAARKAQEAWRAYHDAQLELFLANREASVAATPPKGDTA